ncbi:MAG: 16S rRNA (guanine(966)-N(2))-methyltransferase RsmD [Nitrospirae bacterium]|nr:16S rRNA (guanine(966)-N(2))-methyltransferase RsmD [Nitrospirota bacterium]
MRISGGSAKGRKVGLKKAFTKKGEGSDLRPTSAKVRKAVFDILGAGIIDARFLDLYAGTGAVGIEALSRGAGRVVFVDENALRVKIIRELTEKFGFKDRADVIREKAAVFVKKAESVFDIVFVDPPYASEELQAILPLIDGREILSESGIVIAEHPSKISLPEIIGSLELGKRYKYGDTSLGVYRVSRGQSLFYDSAPLRPW